MEENQLETAARGYGGMGIDVTPLIEGVELEFVCSSG